MKFFSNDAKENADEPEYGREQHGDVVTSDPVAVPQQRAGSPWSDAPGSSEASSDSTDTPRFADADSRSTDTDSPSTDTDSQTANADSQTIDAEAGSPDDELAEQERRDGTEEEPAARRDENGTVTTYGPDGTVTEHDADDDVDLDLESGSARADEDSDDAAIKDEGTFDSPQAVEPATGETLSDESDKSDDDEPVAVTEAEEETARDRAEAEAEAEETVEEERADERKAEIDGEPVAIVPEPVPVGAAASTPGSSPASALDRLFTDGDSFAERFRDIQLRFVDSPKEATADAATLVGEAVDRLTDALKAQKEALGGDSDDTEQLRVQLRSYRDLLNRLSAL
ncbi:hypothetical protein ACIA5D_13795 [Actinoplanes sp. NPDC051513]|uniref:hypothetical protein n=1 Tax=Actinoplanes sp. NPDC051513 TaxID=3363908 RepID=UPI003796A318